MDDGKRKGRRTLLLLALIFLGPVAVAITLFYTGFQWRPQGSTAHGVLYQPALPLPDLTATVLGGPGDAIPLRGKWTLFYVGTGDCAESCRDALVAMRQVRRALGKEMARVQRLYLVTGGEVDTHFLQAEHPGIGIVADGAAVAAASRIVGSVQPGDIFLADPLGNLVLRYPAGTTMKGIHDDLKRLLGISTIG